MTRIPETLLWVDPGVAGALPFEIPLDVYTDILYCQAALRVHIKVHQELNNRLLLQYNHSRPEDARLKYVEYEMESIGYDQKKSFDRLRQALDEYCQRMKFRNFAISRESINSLIGERFRAKSVRHVPFEPINVVRRNTEVELQNFIGISPASLPDNSVVDSDSRSSSPFHPQNCTMMPTEKIEVLLNPVEITPPTQLAANPGMNKPQQSLLKPKSERVQFTATSNKPHGYILHAMNNNMDEQQTYKLESQTEPPKPSSNMNSIRMKLTQALAKAKHEQMSTPTPKPMAPMAKLDPEIQNNSSQVTPAPTRSNTSSPISSDEQSASSATSERSVVNRMRTKNAAPARRAANIKRARGAKSPSPSSSSMDSVEAVELPEEDEEPTTLGKEAFMRVFGLCTHTYHGFLTSRRSERKRRNVTSTEKGDFHYGKLDLYEQQHRDNKSSKRPILYSPPQTRGVRRRVTTSTAPKTVVAPKVAVKKVSVAKKSRDNSPAGSDDPNNMCMSCTTFTKEKLFECESCNAFYHMNCHKTASILAAAYSNGSSSSTSSQASGTTALGRDKFCPDCLRRRQPATNRNK